MWLHHRQQIYSCLSYTASVCESEPRRSVPGRITCSTDADGLQHTAGSELLHRPPGVNPEQATKTELTSPPSLQKKEKERKDVQKSLFEVVGFNAADVVRSGAVEGVHQHLQGLAELQNTASGANPVQKAHRHGRGRSPGSPPSVCAPWGLVSPNGRSRWPPRSHSPAAGTAQPPAPTNTRSHKVTLP